MFFPVFAVAEGSLIGHQAQQLSTEIDCNCLKTQQALLPAKYQVLTKKISKSSKTYH